MLSLLNSITCSVAFVAKGINLSKFTLNHDYNIQVSYELSSLINAVEIANS
uniref:Uncharacterized protein n=1 Tax=Tetranychus urticae TaxID=32264 RepID=T1KEP4_TETUR